MADFLTTDIGTMATTTGYTQVVPSPAVGTFKIEDGGLVIENTTTTDHNLILEMRRGTTTVNLYDNDLLKKNTFIWQDVIRIPSDFTGIYAKFTAAPAAKPTFYYTGVQE